MAEKVTVMVLKVDLQCSCCYKKVKNLLCKFPQIRDQVYDEKQNTVTISVLCCSPQKIRDKLCCKGGKVIKSIEIKSPPKPKEPEKSELPEKPPKEQEKPNSNGYTSIFPYEPCCEHCSQGRAGSPCYHGYRRPHPPCCGPCSQGRAGGPCYHGFFGYVCYHAYVRLEPNCYDNYGYNNNSCNYGYGGRHCYARACDCYPYGENTSSTCTIM